MKPRFTPGPWRWNGPYTLSPVDRQPSDQYIHTILTVDQIGFSYAGNTDLQSAIVESNANQHLIEASPDLYDAAKAALDVLERQPRSARTSPQSIAIAKLKAALGKATCHDPISYLEAA